MMWLRLLPAAAQLPVVACRTNPGDTHSCSLPKCPFPAGARSSAPVHVHQVCASCGQPPRCPAAYGRQYSCANAVLIITLINGILSQAYIAFPWWPSQDALCPPPQQGVVAAHTRSELLLAGEYLQTVSRSATQLTRKSLGLSLHSVFIAFWLLACFIQPTQALVLGRSHTDYLQERCRVHATLSGQQTRQDKCKPLPTLEACSNAVTNTRAPFRPVGQTVSTLGRCGTSML